MHRKEKGDGQRSWWRCPVRARLHLPTHAEGSEELVVLVAR
jgi:hypothetical protein